MSWSTVIHYDAERGGGVLASRTPVGAHRRAGVCAGN